MPFAGYKDFADCVAKNSDKGDPKAYCGTIQHKVEGMIEQATQYSTSDKDSRLYIKRFLIDTSINMNDWGVSADTINERIGSFIGRPLVLTENFDHPVLDDQDFEHNLSYQEKYAIGRVVEIDREGTSYNAIIEITNKMAAEAIRQGNIPIHTSPAISVVGIQPDIDIRMWQGLHLAVVKDPAFGFHRTSVAGHCDGNKDTCLMVLRKANRDCGFCAGAKLQELISNNSNSEHNSHINTSQNIANLDTNPNSTPSSNSKKADKKQLKKTAKAFGKVLETQKVGYESKIKTLEAEVATLKAAKADFEAKTAANEKNSRKIAIEGILTAEIYADKSVREALVSSYVESGLSLDNIKLAVSGMTKTKVASVTHNTSVPYTSEPEAEPAFFLPAGVVI